MIRSINSHNIDLDAKQENIAQEDSCKKQCSDTLLNRDVSYDELSTYQINKIRRVKAAIEGPKYSQDNPIYFISHPGYIQNFADQDHDCVKFYGDYTIAAKQNNTNENKQLLNVYDDVHIAGKIYHSSPLPCKKFFLNQGVFYKHAIHRKSGLYKKHNTDAIDLFNLKENSKFTTTSFLLPYISHLIQSCHNLMNKFPTINRLQIIRLAEIIRDMRQEVDYPKKLDANVARLWSRIGINPATANAMLQAQEAAEMDADCIQAYGASEVRLKRLRSPGVNTPLEETDQFKERKYFKGQIHMNKLSAAFRSLIIDTVYWAKAGYYGQPMGFADVMTVLAFEFLNLQDKIILSPGSSSLILYVLYHLVDHPWFSVEELKKFRRLGSNTPGNPEYNHTINATTGPAGQGIGNALGMALAAKKMGQNHRIFCIVSENCLMEGIAYEAISLAAHLKLDNLVLLFDSNRTTMEGSIALASTDVQKQKMIAMGWRAISVSGHDLKDIRRGLLCATETDPKLRPCFVEFKTNIGKMTKFESQNRAFYGNLSEEDVSYIKNRLGNKHEPFHIQSDLRKEWNSLSYLVDPHIIKDHIIYCKTHNLHQDKIKDYQKKHRIEIKDDDIISPKAHQYYGVQYRPRVAGRASAIGVFAGMNIVNIMTDYNSIQRLKNPTLCSKVTFAEDVLMHNNWGNKSARAIISEIFQPIYLQYNNQPVSRLLLNKIIDELMSRGASNVILASSDLGDYVGIRTPQYNPVSAKQHLGNYIHCGSREHLMAAMCNGLAISNLIPICGTYLSMSDYARPAIRISAIMRSKIIYIMTHDSVHIGEDGPIYQPIEQLASYRAMPNLLLFRPYLAQELLLSFECALDYDGPSMIILPKQTLPHPGKVINQEFTTKLQLQNLSGYIIAGELKDPICIISTGSDVDIALKVRTMLAELDPKTLITKVVSVPSISMLDKYLKYTEDLKLQIAFQKESGDNKVDTNMLQELHKHTQSLKDILEAKYIFTIESGSALGLKGIANITKQYSIDQFGESASKDEIQKHFGFSPKDIAKDILQAILA